jgi:hypothetical protein
VSAWLIENENPQQMMRDNSSAEEEFTIIIYNTNRIFDYYWQIHIYLSLLTYFNIEAAHFGIEDGVISKLFA